MTIQLQNKCDLWGGGSCPNPLPTRHVPREFTDKLRAHGHARPVSSFDDTRLEHPELLILHGYEWQDGVFRAGTHDMRYYQTVQFLEDGTIRVLSRCGPRTHIASRTPGGDVKSELKEHSRYELVL